MKKNTLFLTLSLLCLSAGAEATASTTDETPTLVLSDDYLLPADITAGTRIAL
jgi:hypothetical protein